MKKYEALHTEDVGEFQHKDKTAIFKVQVLRRMETDQSGHHSPDEIFVRPGVFIDGKFLNAAPITPVGISKEAVTGAFEECFERARLYRRAFEELESHGIRIDRIRGAIKSVESQSDIEHLKSLSQ